MWTTYTDYSGGEQRKTTDMLQKTNEFLEVVNGHFDEKIGALTSRPGCEMVGWPTSGSKEILGLMPYTGYEGRKLIRANNNSAGTYSQLEWLIGSDWTAITGATTLPADAKSYFINFLDRLVNQGYAASTNSFVNTAILNGTTYSTTENNIKYAPDAKYVVLFNNQIYALNASIDGVRHKSRVYVSSTPREIVTYVSGDHDGVLNTINVDSVKYLKKGMIIDIYTGGTSSKVIDSMTIASIDYAENTINFAPKTIDLSDKDEIYLEDQKGTLNVFWDTREDIGDYYEVKTNDGEEIMGGFVNNNRLVIAKKNSLHKVVGAQTVEVDSKIGVYSPDSIQNIGGYTIFFHNTGFYRYTDGQMPELISQPVEDRIRAMSGGNWDKVVAGNESDQIYIAYIGELQDLGKETTSTSTSSTSTSTTSTSTSTTSVSTSSTSTSSTSSSTSATTVSTSSTSSSTSSTSSSSSTSSTSSSTSSTSSSTSMSTSTIASTGTDYYAVAFYVNMMVWSVYKFPFQIKSMIPYEMHGVKKLYFGDQLGRVMRYGVGHSDCGNPIPLLAKTHPFDDGTPYGEKEYQKLKVYAENGEECKVAISFDDKEYEPITQLDENSKEYTFKPAAKAERYSLLYSQSDTTTPPLIKGHSMLIDPVGEQI